MLLHEEMQGVNTAVSVSKFLTGGKLTSRKRRKRRKETENGLDWSGLDWSGLDSPNSVKWPFSV